MPTRSISKQATVSTGCGVVFMVVFGLIFGLVSLIIVTTVSGVPVLNVVRAQSWQPAECQLTFSQVSHVSSSSKRSSTTSRIDIQYRYVWNDRTYTGTRYDFSVGSDNFNEASKQAIVAQHRPGQTVACFVDPNDPTRSVINRDMKWGYLFGAAFGTPFALVPLLLFFALRRTRTQTRLRIKTTIVTVTNGPSTTASAMTGRAMTGPATASLFAGAPTSTFSSTFTSTSSTPSVPATTTAMSSTIATASVGGPVVLKPEVSRIGRVFGMVLVCLFWNGLVGFFTYMEFRSYIEAGNANLVSHGFSWFLTLFLIPFQLIGLGLVWAVVRSVLALANPKPTLTLSAASVPVGGSLTLQWQMSGATGRLRNLRISLRGREEAHYRRGTSSYTDKHTFYETQLVEATDTVRIERGMATMTIPANTMHSFASADNKIIWSLQVKGEIGLWPDVDETFDLVVRPRVG